MIQKPFKIDFHKTPEKIFFHSNPKFRLSDYSSALTKILKSTQSHCHEMFAELHDACCEHVGGAEEFSDDTTDVDEDRQEEVLLHSSSDESLLEEVV